MLLINSATVHSRPGSQDDSYGLTQEQLQKLDGIESPLCEQMCQDESQGKNQEDYYTPLCTSAGQDESDSSSKEGYQCLCTDKRYVELIVSCYVKNCGSNSTAFDIALTSQYGQCLLLGNITYPKPDVFLNDLCLLDDMPQDSVPTDLKLLKDVWPDYSYAQDFPTEMAHSTPPANGTYTVPAWTCTPTTAPTVSGDATPSSTNTPHNGTNHTAVPTTGQGVTGGAEERTVIMGATVMIATIAGLAIFL